MAQQDCEEYPDIYRIPPPSGAPPEIVKRITAANDRSERLYLAVRQILKRDFDFHDRIPDEPRDFPAQLSAKEKAQFVGILGIILADNWEDPTNGKLTPGADDFLVHGNTKNERFVVDRRFIDAVVDAVKEYTASSELFNNVYTLMREEAATGLDTKTRQPTRSA